MKAMFRIAELLPVSTGGSKRKLAGRLVIVPSNLSSGCVVVVGNDSNVQPRTCREGQTVMTTFRWATVHLRFPEPVLASEEYTPVSILVPQHALWFVLSALVGADDVARDD